VEVTLGDGGEYAQRVAVCYQRVRANEDSAVAATGTSPNEHIVSAARSPGSLGGTGVCNMARRYRLKREGR
jgi:hypothetical protein